MNELHLVIRDVNFVFFPKIDYRFEKNFFSIIEFGHRCLYDAGGGGGAGGLCKVPCATTCSHVGGPVGLVRRSLLYSFCLP